MVTLLIGIIPIISLGAFSYIKASRTVQEKANEGNVEILQHTQMRVEQNLKIIDNSTTQFLCTSLVEYSMQQKLSYHDYNTVKDLKQEMNQLQPVMLGIKNIYLVNRNYNWFIYSDGLMDLSELPARLKKLLKSGGNKTTYWIRDIMAEDSTGDVETASGANSVYLIKNYPLNSSQPSGYIIIEVSGYELNKLASNSSRLGTGMILDGNYHLLTQRDERIHGKDLSAMQYIQELKKNSDASGYFDSVIGEKKVQLYFRRSSYNGWNYLSLADIDEINKDSKAIELMTLFFCIGTLLLTIGISFLGSKKMYFPVNKLYETVNRLSDWLKSSSRRMSSNISGNVSILL